MRSSRSIKATLAFFQPGSAFGARMRFNAANPCTRAPPEWRGESSRPSGAEFTLQRGGAISIQGSRLYSTLWHSANRARTVS
jgi:hypothetical protein